MSSRKDRRVWLVIAQVVPIQGTATAVFLVGKRGLKTKNSNQWGFFGGHVDEGETCKEAVVRELREETGMVVSQNSLSFRFKDNFRPKGSSHVRTASWYGVHLKDVQQGLLTVTEEITDYDWIPANPNPSIPLHYSVSHYLEYLKVNNQNNYIDWYGGHISYLQQKGLYK